MSIASTHCVVSLTMEITNVSQSADGCGKLSIEAFVEWSKKEHFGELEQNRIPIEVDYLNSSQQEFDRGQVIFCVGLIGSCRPENDKVLIRIKAHTIVG